MARNDSEWLRMTQNGKKSEFEFFARNEVGICSDSYHSTWNLLGSAQIPSIPLRSARNVWGRVNYLPSTMPPPMSLTTCWWAPLSLPCMTPAPPTTHNASPYHPLMIFTDHWWPFLSLTPMMLAHPPASLTPCWWAFLSNLSTMPSTNNASSHNHQWVFMTRWCVFSPFHPWHCPTQPPTSLYGSLDTPPPFFTSSILFLAHHHPFLTSTTLFCLTTNHPPPPTFNPPLLQWQCNNDEGQYVYV